MPTTADRTVFRSDTTKPKSKRRTWGDTPDSLLRSFRPLPSAESLHPGLDTTLGCIDHNPRSRAIRDAWLPCLAWQHLVRVEAVQA